VLVQQGDRSSTRSSWDAMTRRSALCLHHRAAGSQRTGLDQRHKRTRTAEWVARQSYKHFLGMRLRATLIRDLRSDLRHRCHTPDFARHGHPRQANCTSLAVAEWHCRAVDRIDPARVLRPHHCLRRGASAPDSEIIRRLLQLRQKLIDLCTRMRRFLVRFIGPGSFVHNPSSAGFTHHYVRV